MKLLDVGVYSSLGLGPGRGLVKMKAAVCQIASSTRARVGGRSDLTTSVIQLAEQGSIRIVQDVNRAI